MENPKNDLSKKILEIQRSVGTIGKNGRNTFQNYDYATEADFVHAIKPLLNEHGVIITPQIAAPPTVLEMMGKDGQPNGKKLTTILMKYRLINADDPSDYFEAIVPGQGVDNGDKGVYKAITGAKKYFLANTFMIPTGDDPEKHVGKSSGKVKAVGTSGDF